jgi:phenylpropionate dioxygenase-like ring-hydroxylating dioxygenase large terminal subunit
MFVHENQLRHVLPPQAYFSEDQHRRELERALLPVWHLVATMGDLKRDGDYVTLTLFDRPLLVRRIDGEAHVYLNVCGHRHCLLTSKARGHDPAFRCQYHGWEYQCDGRTGKIPEAGSFRPFDRENARLVKFRSARCGDLVFANLSDSGPSLREQMAETFDPVARAFSEPFRQIWQWDPEYPTNWKIAIENLLESYHIPCLHQKTFGLMPPEEQITHEMNDRWTSFYTEDIHPWVRKGSGRTARALGLPFKGHYTQYHIYPNLVVILMDVVSLVKLVVPTSPTTSRATVRVFGPYGPRRTPLAWISARLNTLFAKEGARKILEEDAAIFRDAQKGMEASVCPGVIGRREERVWAFQDWVLRKCGGESGGMSLPVVEGHTNGAGLK